ncbi:MAG: cytochrome B [Daejeonella sp.]|uniref:cytochrome B n=1 Tax=Daejeonella sp. TaxID=2805397 RepID=UPI003C72C1F9
MYNFLLGLHSGLRYIVLLLLAIAIIMAITALFGKKEYSATNRKINLFTLIATHTQLLAGLILYFVSPLVQYGNMGEAMKNTITRYWTVEHGVLMLFAVVLITVGHARSKKGELAINKHRAIALYYGLALLVIVVAIYQSARPLLGMTVGN